MISAPGYLMSNEMELLAELNREPDRVLFPKEKLK